VIGEGDKVLFWKDLWVGDAPLSSRFHRLYLISESKQSPIARVGHWVDNTWVWELVWRRQRLVWEQAMEAQLYQLINSHTFRKGNLDTWSWKETAKGACTVRSAYMKLMGSSEGESDKVFTELWSIRVIPKAQLFGWRLLLDKLPTKDKLSVKGVQLQHSLCEFCLDCEESASHLFFSCAMSQKVWKMCDSWIGVSSVHHNQARIHFQHFHMSSLNTRQNTMWKGMWLAIVGKIWRHRNEVIFKQKKVDTEEIFSLAQVNAWAWLKHKIPFVKFSYNDWYFAPIVCLKSL